MLRLQIVAAGSGWTIGRIGARIYVGAGSGWTIGRIGARIYVGADWIICASAPTERRVPDDRILTMRELKDLAEHESN